MKFILLTFFLCSFASAQVFIKESRYLYSGKDYIGSLHFLSDLKDEDKENLIKELGFTYKNIDIELHERDENYFKFTESRYYFGNHNKLNMIANFINYPASASNEFAKHICEEVPCDFIYKGPFITGYSFNKISLPRTKDFNYYFVTKDSSFSFDKTTPPKFIDMILAENNSEVSYTGEKGQVLYYKPDHDDDRYDPTGGVFLKKGLHEMFIASDYRFKPYMDKILSFTESDCILYRQESAYYQCDRDKKIEEDDLKGMAENIKIVYPAGYLHLEMEEDYIKDVFIDLNRYSTMSYAYDDKKIDVIKKGYKKIDDKLPTHLKNVKLIYKKGEYQLASVIYHGVSKENRDILHETIAKFTDANLFEIYKLNPNGDLLLSKNSIEHFDEYNKKHGSKLFKKFHSFYFGVDVLSNEILASSTHNYLVRKKTPHISLIDAEYTIWPNRKAWGAKANFQYYKVNNSQVDSFGSTEEVPGSIMKFSLSGQFRKLLRKAKRPTTIFLGMGLDMWNYTAEANDSIGSLNLKMAHFYYSTRQKYEKFDFKWGLKGGAHLQVDQEFKTTVDIGKPFGMFGELRGEVIYPVNKKLDLSAGAKYGYHRISSSDVNIEVKEMGFMMGLTWSFNED